MVCPVTLRRTLYRHLFIHPVPRPCKLPCKLLENIEEVFPQQSDLGVSHGTYYRWLILLQLRVLVVLFFLPLYATFSFLSSLSRTWHRCTLHVISFFLSPVSSGLRYMCYFNSLVWYVTCSLLLQGIISRPPQDATCCDGCPMYETMGRPWAWLGVPFW